MISEFESTLVRTTATEERAVQAVEEACCTQEEACRIHAEVMKAYISTLTTMEQGGSSVAASEIADMRDEEESGSELELGEEEEGEVAGGAGDGDYEDGSAVTF
jgi:hypothetical protein